MRGVGRTVGEKKIGLRTLLDSGSGGGLFGLPSVGVWGVLDV